MQTNRKQITFTCKIGSFAFDSDVILSHAKLIRDAVLGQMLAPKPDLPRIRTEEDIYNFVRNHTPDLVATTAFEVKLR